MKVCSHCTLNDNIFSVKIREDGLCNYCFQSLERTDTADYLEAERLLAEAFGKCQELPYQVLLAYSGGKDSTFTLYQLREKYNVSVLALTFDNGFLTEQCRENIHEVTAALGVDSLTVKPSFSNLARIFNLAAAQEIFPKKSLERASSICTSCIGLVKAAVYKEAVLRKIPYVCFGWTPGQAPVKSPVLKLDHRMILANQKQIEAPVIRNLGAEFKKYFIDPDWLKTQEAHIPAHVYPLVFSRYNEDELLGVIKKLGWKKPKDTDMNSTNCLLNSYANFVHTRDYGFNPYSMEIASLVRQGLLSREEGLYKLSISGADAVIDSVRRELDRFPVHKQG